MELIHFIFESFWHFFGTAILIALILQGIAEIIKQSRKKLNSIKIEKLIKKIQEETKEFVEANKIELKNYDLIPFIVDSVIRETRRRLNEDLIKDIKDRIGYNKATIKDKPTEDYQIVHNKCKEFENKYLQSILNKLK